MSEQGELKQLIKERKTTYLEHTMNEVSKCEICTKNDYRRKYG